MSLDQPLLSPSDSPSDDSITFPIEEAEDSTTNIKSLLTKFNSLITTIQSTLTTIEASSPPPASSSTFKALTTNLDLAGDLIPSLHTAFKSSPLSSSSLQSSRPPSLQSASNAVGVTTTLSQTQRSLRKQYNEHRREFQSLIRTYTSLTGRYDEVAESVAGTGSVRMSAESRGGESFVSTAGGGGGGGGSFIGTGGGGYATAGREEEGNVPSRVLVKTYADDVTEQIVQSRAADIEVIARNVANVNEVYRDLANLVDEQQVEIDDIEQNIMMARERTEKGNEQLVKATDFQKSTGRCAKLVIAMVFVAAIVCIGILYGDRIFHGSSK
ncbi:hypothetical protein TrCOL_g7249 [Triparma columacea]|uniref:t-SNARE coiled-coil homology domain-containing protein n=1 Tax=Triparma columacea TaxID=722753 RepID=A0A9W7G398_9STRA|nr:hypothetical protein TrCOL_g7249 [Triparma columacea]